jgi:hypothetical protein
MLDLRILFAAAAAGSAFVLGTATSQAQTAPLKMTGTEMSSTNRYGDVI